MVHRLATVVPLALALGLGLAGPASASAPAKSHDPPRVQQSIEGQAVVSSQLLPRTHFGGDAAYVLGNDTFSARFGGQVLGGRPFDLGDGKMANVLAAFTLDGCGARQVFRHRVRICVGGQGGAMFHRWIGFERPGRKGTPWVAGVLRGDYRYLITERIGVLFGVGVTVPVVGPEFRASSGSRASTQVVFPGPVTGMLTLGASFRVR